MRPALLLVGKPPSTLQGRSQTHWQSGYGLPMQQDGSGNPPALVAAAALAGLAAGVRTQGFFEVPSEADPAL